MGEVGEDARAAHSEWMSNSNGASMDVEPETQRENVVICDV